MCHVSDKIKFCTCSNLEEVEQLDNYWVLHTFVKGKYELLVGQPLMPALFDMDDDLGTRSILLGRVNEPGAFDIPLTPKAKDRLQVTLNITREGFDRRQTYGFEFRKGRWVECDYESFDWFVRHDKKFGGEVIGCGDTQ